MFRCAVGVLKRGGGEREKLDVNYGSKSRRKGTGGVQEREKEAKRGREEDEETGGGNGISWG